MNPAVAGVAELVRQRTGMTVPAARVPALRAAIQRAAPGLGELGFLAAASDPVHGTALVDRLIDEVTVQETFFLRDLDQLDLIPWRALALAARGGRERQVRVWSAGCATGEEVYTLALLAAESFGPAPAPVDVLGTDISCAALAAAADGRYGDRSVRALGPPLRERHLDHEADGRYAVTGRLRAMVRFRRHNLASDAIPPPGEAPFDLIVCRNVLIYFSRPLVTQVSTLLERALAPGGALMLGATDAVARTAAIGVHGRPARRVTKPPAAASSPPRARPGRVTPAADARQPGPSMSREDRLTAALEAADKGESDAALAQVAFVLAADPLDADAHFVGGLVTLQAGEPARAADALRRALYTDPTYALAAFTLGRAFDALGDTTAARRAYGQALRSLDPGDQRHDPMLQQVGLGDIAAACRARLRGSS